MGLGPKQARGAVHPALPSTACLAPMPVPVPSICAFLPFQRTRWMEDITVDHQRPDERPLPPGATETFHLSKKHSSHTKAVKAWEELAAAREKLAGLWAELLLLRLGGQTAASQRGG